LPEKLIIHTDGASRGNPGQAGCGFVIKNSEGQTVLARGCYIGKTTNNIAEYTALQKALDAAIELGADEIEIFSDSELMVKQITGQYRVKNANIKPLYSACMELLNQFDSWKIQHVYRSENARADALANKAIDAKSDIEQDSSEMMLAQDSTDAGKKLRLAVLISGGGRTMLNIHKHIQQKTLNAEIVLVISSRSSVKGIERARQIGIEPAIVRKKDYPDIKQFSSEIVRLLDEAKVDLVIQAGWLCLWQIPQKYENRVMNIHPALLPSFGGKGMWGHHVHEAVLKAGCKVSGCTVHFCNNEYDAGPIIIQRTCPVLDNDTPDTLAERVFKQECIAYPQAIRLFAQGRLIVENGIVKIKK